MASIGDRGRELRAYRRLVGVLRRLPAPTAPAGLAAGLAERLSAEGGEVNGVKYSAVETALGRLFVAYSPRGVRCVAPAEDAAAFEARYAARFGTRPTAAAEPPTELLEAFKRALTGDAEADRRLPLDLEALGPFERLVLEKAREIPRGELRTYAWVAREIARPRAPRAVGRALGRNPIPFIIPCHRVVGSSGSLTGYAFGLPLKRRVLLLEGLDPAELAELERGGAHYVGSQTRGEFCFRTCHQARRFAGPDRVWFRSEAEALARGLRPCRACRPVAVGE